MPRRIGLHVTRLLTAPRLRLARTGEQRSELAIDGLVCSICALRTERALRAVPGVERVSVDLEGGRATIEHRGPAPEPERLAAALEGAVLAPGWRRRIESWARLARRRGRRRSRNAA